MQRMPVSLFLQKKCIFDAKNEATLTTFFNYRLMNIDERPAKNYEK